MADKVFVEGGSVSLAAADLSDIIAAIESIVGTYERTFVNADLVVGVLSVAHNLGLSSPDVVVYDNTSTQISPDSITFTDNNNLTINLSTFVPLTGTWRARVGG